MCFANAQILPSFHICNHEDQRTLFTKQNCDWEWKSLIFYLKRYCQYFQRRQTKLFEGCFQSGFVFFRKTVATFNFSYLLHPEGCHRGELCRAALQEDSNGPQRKSLALLLNNPVSAALGRVSGYRLLSPASNCNFSVVEKRDSFFSEPLSAISRQCHRRQFLSSWESRGFKETVRNYRDVRWCTWLTQRSVKSFIVIQRKTDLFSPLFQPQRTAE